MNKEYYEYMANEGRVPYSISTIWQNILKYAYLYLKNNSKKIPNQKEILTLAINYIAAQGEIDLKLKENDLDKDFDLNEVMQVECLLTVMLNQFSYFAYAGEITNYSKNNIAIVICDFMNYISFINGYIKKFSLNELYQRYEYVKYKLDMKELKDFIEHTYLYYADINSASDINDVYESLHYIYDLDYIASDGTGYYTLKHTDIVGQRVMKSFDQEMLDEELYALAYGYAKKYPLVNNTYIDVINKRIREMKTI